MYSVSIFCTKYGFFVFLFTRLCFFLLKKKKIEENSENFVVIFFSSKSNVVFPVDYKENYLKIMVLNLKNYDYLFVFLYSETTQKFILVSFSTLKNI